MLSMTKKTFWITKYALTTGILKKECDLVDSGNGRFYASSAGLFCRVGTDAFETEEEATANAIKKAATKLRSLDTAKSKLLALRTAWAGDLISATRGAGTPKPSSR